jgi:hypothetical protein
MPQYLILRVTIDPTSEDYRRIEEQMEIIHSHFQSRGLDSQIDFEFFESADCNCNKIRMRGFYSNHGCL